MSHQGSAAAGGFDFQARAVAFVAVHILTQKPLRWVEGRALVPVAVLAESGGAGDDLRVETATPNVALEVQAKKGLTFDAARMKPTLDRFADDLAADGSEIPVILTDPSSSAPVKELGQALRRHQAGRSDELGSAFAKALAHLRERGRPEIVDTLCVTEVDLLGDASLLIPLACAWVAPLLDDESDAEAAWEVLVALSLAVTRTRGRLDRQRIIAELELRGITLSDRRPASSPQAGELGEELRRIAARVETMSSTPPANAEEPELVRVARELVDGGELAGARGLLSRITVESDSPPVLGEAYNLLGVIAIRSGDDEDAAILFEKSLGFDGNHYAALVNLAALELARGDTSQARLRVEKAIALKPDRAEAWGLLIRLSNGGDSLDPPVELAGHPILLHALAQKAFADQEEDRGISLLKDAIQDERVGTGELLLYAQAVVYRAFGGRSAQPDEDLIAAADAAKRVLAQLGDEPSVNAAQSLLIRADIARHNGEFQEAEELLVEARRRSPTAWEPLYVLALVRAQTGRIAEAVETLKEISTDGAVARLNALAGNLLTELGRAEEARERLDRAASAPDLYEDPEVTLQAATLAVETGALDVASSIVAGWPPETEPGLQALAQARLFRARGDSAQAVAGYEAAAAAGNAKARQGILLELARYFAHQGRYAEAASTYEAAGASSHPEEDVRKAYAHALFKSRQLSRVSEELRRAAQAGFAGPWIDDLAALTAHLRGDPRTEAEHLRSLVTAIPEEMEFRIRLAQALIRLGEEDAVTEVLEEADAVVARADAEELTRLAHLNLHIGRVERVLPLGYAALRKGDDKADAEFGYMALFFRPNVHYPGLEPSEVEPGTHVVIRGTKSGETIEYTILHADDEPRFSNEFKPTSDAVADILGLRVGQRVTRRTGQLSEETYEVQEIKSAYLHAFHELTETYHARHPDDTRIQRFTIGDESQPDLTPIVRSAAMRRSHADAVLEHYRKGLLPIGVLAKALGADLPDIYAAIVGQPDVFLAVEFSDTPSLQEALQIARSAGPVVVTRSALVTVQELDLFDSIVDLGLELKATQSLIDELWEEVNELEIHRETGRNRIATDSGGALIPIVEPAADTQRHLAARSRLYQWVKENAEVVPLPFEAGAPEHDTARELIGKSSADARLVALSQGWPLYADDLGLRKVDFSPVPGTPAGFSTGALLFAARLDGTLSQDDANAGIAKLIQLRHIFLPISAELLHHMLRINGYALNGEVIAAFERLGPVHADTPSAVATAVQLIKEVALTTASHAIGPVTQLSLEVLQEHGDGALRLFFLATKHGLRFLPHAEAAVQEAIVTFLSARETRLGPT